MRFACARLFVWPLCVLIFLPFFAHADVSADQRAALEVQLAQIQNEIKDNQTHLSELQTQRTSLERDVAIYDSKIQAAQLDIKQRNLIIKGLRDDIAQKEASIGILDSKVQSGEESLAQILRETHEVDDTSLAERVLNGSLTDVFQELDDFQTVQKALGDSFDKMTLQRADLSARKQALEDQQQEEKDLLQIQVLQQNALKDAQKQKQDLVAAAKGRESVYQQIIASKQQTAAQIESALFALRDTAAVTFGELYSYAKEAYAKTNVPPAFILAILSQESDSGQNIGSCYVTDLSTGDGIGKNSGEQFEQVMKSPRDTVPFQAITSTFNMNWSTTPVSCPFGKVYTRSRGYGGAMGPAQFIPSTWQVYADRIAAATGKQLSNPWDPRTATFAIALYMADLGADAGTAPAERAAALKYFAGGHWQNPAYGFYGRQVMDKVDNFEQQIAILGG